MTITLFGIKNCDSVKKAQRWLEQAGIDYQFHDFRGAGLSEPLLDSWLQQCEWSALLNKRSTSFRQLDEADKQVADEAHAKRLLLAQPTLVKRPVLTYAGGILIGFNANQYAEQLSAQ